MSNRSNLPPTTTPSATPTDAPPPTITLGKLNVAEDVLQALTRNGQSIFFFLELHANGNSGLVDQPTRESNRRGVLHGFRVKSLYRLNDDILIGIRTDAGRRETTVDLESEDE